MTRYPVYVLSKGRYKNCLTARFLQREGVDFRLVVEPQEEKQYRSKFDEHVTVLPEESAGHGAIPVRNWIWSDAIERGAERHWILDDNIREVRRLWKGKRIPCDSLPAFRCVEDFADRYTNVGIAGLNYQMFGMPSGMPPFFTNVHVYSFMLIDSSLPFRWRGPYHGDTDLCLQVLAAGLCTVLVNVFLADKQRTMVHAGGNTGRHVAQDGRLKMARELERRWPGVVTVRRRWERPQHVVNWRRFDTPLKRKPGVEIPAEPNEYGLELTEVQGRVRRRAGT